MEERDKVQKITSSHVYRREMIDDIVHARIETHQKHCEYLLKVHQPDNHLGIINRIKGQTIRSYKNHLLSLNSIFCLAAEYGGMDDVMSHYQAEKYAIIIENASTKEQLDQICEEYIYTYLDPKNRAIFKGNISLSEAVDRYIRQEFMNKIDVKQIADHFFVSREHLSRTYKAETGMTVNEKITDIRLKEAKRFLTQSQLAITEIALIVGFNSSQYFSTIFKERVGQTPTEFRKEHMNK